MDENILWRSRQVFPGTVSLVNPNSKFVVQLDDGRTIVTSISSYVARLMFRIKIGDRVFVKFRNFPKSPRIIGFESNI